MIFVVLHRGNNFYQGKKGKIMSKKLSLFWQQVWAAVTAV